MRTPSATRPVLPTVLAVVGALALAGCSGGDDAAGATPTPTADETVTGTVVEAASDPAVVAACEPVTLEADASVAGADVAACVAAFSTAAATGSEYVLSGDTSGVVQFAYGDAAAMSGQLDTTSGPVAFVVNPDGQWVQDAGTWAEGDVDATYLQLADPTLTVDLVQASAQWQVQADQDVIDLPDGTSEQAWRLQSAEAFTWGGAEVQEAVLWLTDDHVVVGQQLTTSADGTTATRLNQYYGWGQPVQVEAPTAG